jgi:4-carboxymuconolactone decarboxylase
MSAASGSPGSDRLPRLTPERLDEEQQAVYAAIAGGPRAAGPQAFPLTGPDGSLNGPFGVMLHAPSVGAPLQDLGSAIRYRTGLSARIREIAILQVAVATDSRFEWWAHERVGRQVGLTDLELTWLANAAPLQLADPVEQAAHDFVSAVLRGPAVPSEEYAQAEAVLGQRALVELTVLVGYYRLLSETMHVFAVGVPGETGPTPAHTHG